MSYKKSLRRLAAGFSLIVSIFAVACVVGAEPRNVSDGVGLGVPTSVPTLATFPGVPVDFTFARNLEEGMEGMDVKYLQIILNSDPDTAIAGSGPGSPGQETILYGASTREALMRFQEKYADEILEPTGLVKGTGLVGPNTRSKMNETISAPQPLVVRTVDGEPRFKKGCNSQIDQWRKYTTAKGHGYVWGYVGGNGSGSSQPDCWAEFIAFIEDGGEYEVYAAYYADPQSSTKVPVTVFHGTESTTVEVDQQDSNYFTWREEKLGMWQFDAGETVRVRFTDATGEEYDGNTTLNVDTVVFVRVGNPYDGIRDLPDPIIVRASIDHFSPEEPVEVLVEKRIPLEFSFTNTGTTQWTYQAAASLRKPDGTEIHLPLRPIVLNPGEQSTALWRHIIDEPGPWDVAFGLWKDEEQSTPLGSTSWMEGMVNGKPPE